MPLFFVNKTYFISNLIGGYKKRPKNQVFYFISLKNCFNTFSGFSCSALGS